MNYNSASYLLPQFSIQIQENSKSILNDTQPKLWCHFLSRVITYKNNSKMWRTFRGLTVKQRRLYVINTHTHTHKLNSPYLITRVWTHKRHNKGTCWQLKILKYKSWSINSLFIFVCVVSYLQHNRQIQ